MLIVKRLLSLLLLLPLVQGAEPSDAAALWEQQYGGGLVEEAGFPRIVMDGDQFQATLQLTGPVDDVRYQICSIGNVCWVANVPLENSGNLWSLDTADIPELQPDVRSNPIHFEAGTRVGVQFFVTIGNETREFPHGEECDVLASDEEWLACQETHYFGVNVVAGEKSTPPIALPLVLVALLWVTRRV